MHNGSGLGRLLHRIGSGWAIMAFRARLDRRHVSEATMRMRRAAARVETFGGGTGVLDV
jgi:hypothetical protein